MKFVFLQVIMEFGYLMCVSVECLIDKMDCV